MHPRLPAIFVVVAVLSGVSVVQAQSLGEIARQEEERRKTVKGDAKVYTNKDLTGGPAFVALPPAPPPAAKDEEGAKAKDTAAKDAEQADASGTRGQAYWAERRKTLQTALERNLTYVEALQSRINALTTDFVNRDDPAQRATIEADRQRALAELERLKQQIEDDRKALADLEAEARRAGVPPGWLR